MITFNSKDKLNILILIIEDDKYMNETLREVLENEGYWVTTELNALNAIERLIQAGTNYDILVLDYDLKDTIGINSLDIFDIAKKENPEVNAVMLTAFASDNNIKNKIISNGIDVLIEKPFMLLDLVYTINDLTREHHNYHHQYN